MTDRDYMEMAISLARKGTGSVNPNPLVGAVIVKNDKIIGSGYHEKYGELHAERNAIANCVESPEGSTIYVTLEPCCHYGKTPPCTQAIIENKIAKVVIGSRDHNPLVAGKGVEQLRANGIEVVEDFMREECDDINKVFFHYITRKMPYVAMKYAMTFDGKIATHLGESKWITNEKSREYVQELRNKYTGIMVGKNTVLQDNPMLNCRIPNGRNPVRIICDTNLNIPIECNIVNTAKEITTYIATACKDRNKQENYIAKGCNIIELSMKDKYIDLTELMLKLGELKIDGILLEGGSELNYSMLNEGLVNKIYAFVAPKIFGGNGGKSPVGGAGIDYPAQAYEINRPKVTYFDNDILIEGGVKYRCLQE